MLANYMDQDWEIVDNDDEWSLIQQELLKTNDSDGRLTVFSCQTSIYILIIAIMTIFLAADEVERYIDLPTNGGKSTESSSELIVIKTIYFEYYISPHEENAIHEIVADIDSTYEELSAITGLTLPPSAKRVVITINLAQQQESSISLSAQEIKLVIPSNSILMTEKEEIALLRKLVGEAVIELVIDEYSKGFIDNQTAWHVWHLIPDALSIWQKWTLDNEPKIGNIQFESQNADIERLIDFRWDEYEPGNTRFDDNKVNQLATILDYIYHVHGKSDLAVFLRHLNIYSSWDLLIPSIFDISKDQFQREWIDHLEEHGLSTTLD